MGYNYLLAFSFITKPIGILGPSKNYSRHQNYTGELDLLKFEIKSMCVPQSFGFSQNSGVRFGYNMVVKFLQRADLSPHM